MNILITGGTGGVGRAAVELLSTDASNHIYFTYCHNEQKAQVIGSGSANITPVWCDFSDTDSLSKLLNAIQEMDLDVLVNNAWSGKPEGIRFHKLKPEDVMSTVTNNLLPIISITQKALDTFRKKKSGKIITNLTLSIYSTPTLGYSLYSSAKAFVGQMAKSWASEYAKMGITSNCLSPDFMKTDFTADTDERVIDQLEAAHPLKRILDPKEVAEVIRFLVYAPTQLNGVNIPISSAVRF